MRSLTRRAGAQRWIKGAARNEPPGTKEPTAPQRELGKYRVDYQKLLSEPEFALYVKLRDWRKTQSEEQGVPPFSIFHNATLASIAA